MTSRIENLYARLAHMEREATRAMRGDEFVVPGTTAFFYGQQYHRVAEEIKAITGVDPRPAF